VVRLTKIYTKHGDGGTTRLVGGQEVAKDSLRIEAYGTVDELNSIVGIVRVKLGESEASPELRGRFELWLKQVQNDLFNLGSDLATRIEDRRDGQPVIEESHVVALETLMDELNVNLPALDSFVLPGGGPIGAFLHQARTVCRRAERVMVALAHNEELGPQAIPYINRLSDALFVWSRWVSKQLGEEELLWEPAS